MSTEIQGLVQQEFAADNNMEHARLRVLYHAGLLDETQGFRMDLNKELTDKGIDLRLPTTDEFLLVATNEVSEFSERVQVSRLVPDKEELTDAFTSHVLFLGEQYEEAQLYKKKAYEIISRRDEFLRRFHGSGLMMSQSDFQQFEEVNASIYDFYQDFSQKYPQVAQNIQAVDLNLLGDGLAAQALRSYGTVVLDVQNILFSGMNREASKSKLLKSVGGVFEPGSQLNVVVPPDPAELQQVSLLDDIAQTILAQSPVDPETAFVDSTPAPVEIWDSALPDKLAGGRPKKEDPLKLGIVDMFNRTPNVEIGIDLIVEEVFPGRDEEGQKVARAAINRYVYALKKQGINVENTAKPGSRALYVFHPNEAEPTVGSAAGTIMPIIPAAQATEIEGASNDDTYAESEHQLPNGTVIKGTVALLLSGAQNESIAKSDVTRTYGISEEELKKRVKEFNDAGHGYRLEGKLNELEEEIYHLVEYVPINPTAETVFQDHYPVYSEVPLTHEVIATKFNLEQAGLFEILVSNAQTKFHVSRDAAARLIYGIVLKNNLLQPNWAVHSKSKKNAPLQMNRDVSGQFTGAFKLVQSKIDAMVNHPVK